jgi:hypothetical protein
MLDERGVWSAMEEESYLCEQLVCTVCPNSAKLYGGGEVVFPRPPKSVTEKNAELLGHSI